MGQQKRLGAVPDPQWHLAVLDVYDKARLEKPSPKSPVGALGGISLEKQAVKPEMGTRGGLQLSTNSASPGDWVKRRQLGIRAGRSRHVRRARVRTAPRHGVDQAAV